MNEKLIKVFYGNDNLPYKDNTRTIHFPIVGNAFLGASETTKIRFYFDYIGDSSTTWVSVAKLPNGKQGSKVLSVASDEDGNYAELSLSNWYTQAKGDVYIALQGYQGGVEYELNEDDIYEIHGTPIIQTTGSIKLAINYAPIGQVADYNDEYTTYQEILSALGDKLGVENGIVSVELTSILTTDELLNNGGIGLNKPFVLDNNGETLICYLSEENGTYVLNAIGKTSAYSCSFTENTLVRNLFNDSVLDISYLPIIELTEAMQVLTASELEIAEQDNSIIKYNGRLYHKANETTTAIEFVSADYDMSDIGANNQIAKYEISVNRASGSTTMFEQYLQIYSVGEIDALLSSYYTKTEIDNLLADKQNRLVSGTNIKTINGESLLGSGNIDIQGGGSVEVDDQLSPTSTNPVENRVITNELGNVRAELLGKSNSLSLSYNQPLPTSSNITQFTKFDGTHFTDMTDFNTYVSGLTFANSGFNAQTTVLTFSETDYLIDANYRVVKATDIMNNYKVGQFNIYITETNIPDRWLAFIAILPNDSKILVFYPLETEKVDLSSYATTSALGNAIDKVNNDLAPNYSPLNIYSIGDKVIYNGQLYTCTYNMSAAEDFDATHWSAISVSGGFVDLDSAQTISGVKTFNEIDIAGTTTHLIKDSNNKGEVGQPNNSFRFDDNNIRIDSPQLRPQTDASTALGVSNIRFSAVHCSTIHNDYSSLILYANGFVNINFTGNDRALRPSQNNAHDLGGTDNKWRDLYLGNSIIFNSGASGETSWSIQKDGLNQIGIYGGSTKLYNIQGGAFYSLNSNGTNLGRSSNPWTDLYLSGTAYVGTNLQLATINNRYLYLTRDSEYNLSLKENVNGVDNYLYTINNSSFSPRGAQTRDLGNSGTKWRDLYLSRNLTDGTNSVSVAELKALIDYAKAQGWIS